MSYWNFQEDLNGQKPYPDIVPIGTKADINIIDHFVWTLSPPGARHSVPRLKLTEKRIIANTIISDIANSIFAGADAIARYDQTQGNFVPDGSDVAEGLRTFDSAKMSSTIKKFFKEKFNIDNFATEGISNMAGNLANPVLTRVNAVMRDGGFSQSELRPYSYMYMTEPTNFEYTIPFFDDAMVAAKNRFGSSSRGIGSGIADTSYNLASNVADISNMLTMGPGTYIERSLSYQLEQEGQVQFKCTFPLLNTQSVVDIQKNWEFLFGLIYQNTPGRVSRSTLDLPVLYEAFLPGNVYYPYTYIQSIKVGFLGTRRQVMLDLPKINGQSSGETFTTIVPDAYEVQIELAALNVTSKNFLALGLRSNYGGFNIKVKPLPQGIIDQQPQSSNPIGSEDSLP